MESTLEQLKYPIGRYQKPEKFDPALLPEWIGVLKALPLWMDTCIENLDEAQLHIPYREGGWTIQQVIHHLADSHMNAFLTEDFSWAMIELGVEEPLPPQDTIDELYVATSLHLFRSH